VGVKGIVPSMRLKWIRKGVEDYEYVELLKKRGRGEWALSIVRQVATDFQNWSDDPAAIERAPADDGRSFEPALIGGGPSPHNAIPELPSSAKTAVAEIKENQMSQ